MELVVGFAPACRLTNDKALRPFNGSSRSCCVEIVLLSSPFVELICSAPAVTVTCSETCPTSIKAFNGYSRPALIVTSLAVKVL